MAVMLSAGLMGNLSRLRLWGFHVECRPHACAYVPLNWLHAQMHSGSFNGWHVSVFQCVCRVKPCIYFRKLWCCVQQQPLCN